MSILLNLNRNYIHQVEDKAARDWYEKEAAEQTWSVRTLQRNISSQYYYRMLKTQKKELVESEMKELTASYQNDKLEFIKNPVVAEFLGFSQNTDFTESDLEKSILSNLQKFLMELGKGYAFVARQQHIHTEKQDYYIDLVFYNYILKCFVLIDLKTEKITHQDVGQIPNCFMDRTLFSCLVIVRKTPLKRLQNGIVWRYRRVALRMCRLPISLRWIAINNTCFCPIRTTRFLARVIPV